MLVQFGEPKRGTMPVYLFRRSTRYHVRVCIPPDLQPYFHRADHPPPREFKFSLRTGDLRKARHRSRLIVSHIHSMFGALRLKANLRKEGEMDDTTRMSGTRKLESLTPEQLNEIIRNYVRDALDWEEDYQSTKRLNPYEHEDRIESLEGLIQDQKAIVGEGRHLQELGHHAVNLLQREGIPNPNQKADEFNRLCRMMAYADVRTTEVALKWLRGDYSAGDVGRVIEDLGVNGSCTPGSPAGGGLAPSVPQVEEEGLPNGITLGEVVATFWEERAPVWKPRSHADYRTCKAHLLSELGENTPVSSLDYFKVKAYRDKLRTKGLSVARVNFYVGFLKMVLNFEMKTTRVHKVNPCEALTLKETRRKDEMRDAFDSEDLKKIFVLSDEYSKDQHDKPERFWIPLLGLYTGARLEELCQLYCDQVAEVDGYRCLVFEQTYKEQSIKTSEKRTVPLHPFLIDSLGFHRFAKKQGGAGDRLWPELPRVKNRYGHYFGRWFKTFKDGCGIDPRPNYKVFHSFRHTVETKLQYEEVDQKYINQLVGHSDKAESARYGKRNMQRLFENAVMKLTWAEELDFSHLERSKWAIRK